MTIFGLMALSKCVFVGRGMLVQLCGFDVLLTVHLGIFISPFNQLDAQNLFHNKFYFMPLHVSSTYAHHCITQPLVSSHL